MTKLEYVWIDGTEDAPQLRSKTKVVENFTHDIMGCPLWGFDGSSTNQAIDFRYERRFDKVLVDIGPEADNFFYLKARDPKFIKIPPLGN